MNKRTMKLTALALAALMLLSSLWVVVTAAPAEYSTQSNSGKRDEVCLSLEGTGAESYYTGGYTFDNLAAKTPSGLKSSLHDLMTNTHKKITSYADCRDYVFRVDCERNDTTHATTLYTSYSMTQSDWSPSWACNREHVWPQSLGGNNTSGGGADLHHIRPAEAGVNSSRGNKPYGESTSKGFYEPADHVKGDVARIILYVYVRWDAAWGATDVTEVFESVDILLAWCEMDPVDTWEMGRNEVVQSIQGNRNTFIDYPELAWIMFGREVPEDMITPSGSAMDGELPTYAPETETDPEETETDAPAGPSNALATFTFGDNGGAAHNDGTDITSTKSFTDGNYTLTLTNPTKLYGNARDAKGNSCLKLGSSKATGGFSFTVPADVEEVVIHAAKYKASNSTVLINGTRYGLTTASNDGEYTPLVIDTSKTKTVTVATVSGASRCMINTIEFMGSGVAEETDPPATEAPTEKPTEEPTEEPTETPTEEPTEAPTEAPTEEPTEAPTEEPTEAPTETPTETPTEEPTEQPTDTPTEEVTTEAAPTESETEKATDEPAETDPATSADTTAEGATETVPADTGCGSAFTGVAVMISMLGLGVYALARKRKED